MLIVIEQCSMRDPWMIGQLFQIYNNYNWETWQSRWWKYWTTKYRREKRINQKSDLVISTFKHISESPLYCLAWRFSFREWPMLSFLLFHLANNRIICAQYTSYMSLLLLGYFNDWGRSEIQEINWIIE